MSVSERRSLEVSGKTVEEAVEKALAQLKATRDQVEIEVIHPGTRGLLGLVLEEAQVRVSLTSPAAPAGLASAREAARVAQEVLEKLLVGMGIHARISRRVETEGTPEGEPTILLDVKGRDLGILIGRRGETLRALQYLTRLLTSRRAQRWVGVVVDIDGYTERRQTTLQELALRMAQRAQAEGRPVALEPMPPHERRIVHLALRDHALVTTQSSGEGEERKVVIHPKKPS